MQMKFGLALLLGAAFLLSNCSDNKGFKKSDTGLLYNFHVKSESGKKPAEGDVILCSMEYRTYDERDSLIFTSNGRPNGNEFMIQIQKPLYKGDIMEGLAMMEVGDSASFVVSADSFFVKNAQIEIPQGLKSGDMLIFHVSLNDFKTMAQLEAESIKENASRKEQMDLLQETEQERINTYLATKEIKQKALPSGLYYIETLKGNGAQAKKGQTVSVHYSGYLLNGKKFDSSFDRDQPFSFRLGEGEVIAGWDEGVSLMRIGGTATFIIPSILGYGSNGQGMIEPFSPLVFEVQLINAE